MGELASELGIGRATLYRWVGSRDALLAETIWDIVSPRLAEYEEQTRRLRGRNRIIAVMREIGEVIINWEAYERFLQREPVAALRILTTKATDVQSNTVAFIAGLLREEQGRGALDLPSDVSTEAVAYAIVRLAESFFYADVISGRKSNVDEAMSVIGLLLPQRRIA